MLRKLISYLIILSIFISDLGGWANSPAHAMLNPAEEGKQQFIPLRSRLTEASDQTTFTTIVAEKKQSQENPDLPLSISLRARVVKAPINNPAKAQINDDDSYRSELYEPTLIYEFQGPPSQAPFSSISFIYEGNGVLDDNRKKHVFYGKKCEKGELLLPETNIIYKKSYLYLENNICITEFREQHKEELSYYVFPFGVFHKGEEPVWFYYPYGGMTKDGNDIAGAEQVYFSLKDSRSRVNPHSHETKISRDFHSTLVHEGINFLEIGQVGGIKINERSDKYFGPTEYHRSVVDIPEEQGISAGAALCGGYAKFEYVKDPLRQVYKSFHYTHPGNNSNLVDILFVQDLDHDSLPKFVDLPLQVDPSIQYLNDYLLRKLQEVFREKIQLKKNLIESDDQGYIEKALSPFWEDIQSCLVTTAKFIDQHPLLAGLTINGLQFFMGGPVKFAITKIADYLASDLMENSKEKAQQFLSEQLGIPSDQIELATAVIEMGVDLFLSRPGNILKSAKKVIEAAERRAINRNHLKHRFSLKHEGELFSKPNSSLSALDLAQRKRPIKT